MWTSDLLLGATPRLLRVGPPLLPIVETIRAMEFVISGWRNRSRPHASRAGQSAVGAHRALPENHRVGQLASVRVPQVAMVGSPLDTKAAGGRLAQVGARFGACRRPRQHLARGGRRTATCRRQGAGAASRRTVHEHPAKGPRTRIGLAEKWRMGCQVVDALSTCCGLMPVTAHCVATRSNRLIRGRSHLRRRGGVASGRSL
mmetsp:Transcript_122250/g.260876  ORF Transcript_122250/g.260876 Transcript_122250/m.260876 type:complete len:202 (-) Transcript_122250:250-855(-)